MRRESSFSVESWLDYRGCADLNRCIVDNLSKVPRDVDAVVGIPRSGMLAACLLALHLNLPLTDLDGLFQGRFPSGGDRAKHGAKDRIEHVLVMDDDVKTGAALAATRKLITEANLGYRYTFAVAYASQGQAHLADVVFEIVEGAQRIFEWKMMNNGMLGSVCFDMDGVLCRDALPEEDDDGDQYRRFLEHAEPKFRPARKIGWIISSRIEKYRKLTEQWLSRHGIEYGELILMDYPSKEERNRADPSRFKAQVYSDKPSWLFVESNPIHAMNISRWSGKPVYCVDDSRMYYPEEFHVARGKLKRRLTSLPQSLKRFMIERANSLLRKIS